MSRSTGTKQAATSQAAPDEWFTIEEAAALVKVPARRMRRWVYGGQVKSIVLPGGRGRRISRKHLTDAMATEATPGNYR